MKITLINLGAEFSKLHPDVIKYLRLALPFEKMSQGEPPNVARTLYMAEALHHYTTPKE
jgi:hypothetical protein